MEPLIRGSGTFVTAWVLIHHSLPLQHMLPLSCYTVKVGLISQSGLRLLARVPRPQLVLTYPRLIICIALGIAIYYLGLGGFRRLLEQRTRSYPFQSATRRQRMPNRPHQLLLLMVKLQDPHRFPLWRTGCKRWVTYRSLNHIGAKEMLHFALRHYYLLKMCLVLLHQPIRPLRWLLLSIVRL